MAMYIYERFAEVKHTKREIESETWSAKSPQTGLLALDNPSERVPQPEKKNEQGLVGNCLIKKRLIAPFRYPFTTLDIDIPQGHGSNLFLDAAVPVHILMRLAKHATSVLIPRPSALF